jgi:uncharacterized protein YqgV (UPF0045/DUF77 family)
MNIEIKVSVPMAELNQSQSQTIRRVANVLRDHGFEVKITQSTSITDIAATKFLRVVNKAG